jgi:hypothetical protein
MHDSSLARFMGNLILVTSKSIHFEPGAHPKTRKCNMGKGKIYTNPLHLSLTNNQVQLLEHFKKMVVECSGMWQTSFPCRGTKSYVGSSFMSSTS